MLLLVIDTGNGGSIDHNYLILDCIFCQDRIYYIQLGAFFFDLQGMLCVCEMHLMRIRCLKRDSLGYLRRLEGWICDEHVLSE